MVNNLPAQANAVCDALDRSHRCMVAEPEFVHYRAGGRDP